MSFTRSAEKKEISLAFTTSCVAKQQNPPRNEKAIILTMCSYFPWEASGEVRCSKTVSSTSSTSEIESAKSRSNVFGSSWKALLSLRVHLCYKECCSRTVTPTSSATWLFGSATEQFSQSLPWSLTCPLLAASIVPSSSLSFASDFILSMEKIWLQCSWSSGQTWPCCWFLHPRHSSVSPSASSGMLKRRRSSWFCT